MELSKADSKMLQGLSVCAMVCLHLFDRDYNGLFTPILFGGGVPLSFYFGQLADFCVFGFAFLSGYAHRKQSEQEGFYRRRLKGLLSVLCSYWLIMIVFSLVSAMMGQAETMPGSARTFVLNALTIESSYNGAWWYMFTYALLVLTSPVVMKWVRQCRPVIVLGVGFAVYCTAYYVRFKSAGGGWLLGKYGPFGMTFFEYLLGALAYQYGIFTELYQRWEKLPRTVRRLLAAVLFLGMLYGRTKIVPSLFVAPISGFVLMTLFHFWKKPEPVQRLFLFIGKHSTNIWLTHMFFYLYLFKNLVYLAKYPVLIYGFMMAITLLLSMVLQKIERPIQNRIAQI